MIMIVKTPGSQKGSPAVAEEGAEGGEGEGGRKGEREGECKRGDVGVDGAKSEIKVGRRRVPE